jgi:hypothetical protein
MNERPLLPQSGHSQPHKNIRFCLHHPRQLSLASITGEVVPGGWMAEVGPTCSAPMTVIDNILTDRF